MLHLNSLLTTHPRMKAIVTTKNPVRLFFSWARRGIEFRDKHEPNISIEGLVREKLDTYAEHFHHYFEGLNEAYQIHGEDRILPVPYEKLCRNPAIIAQKMFDFTGYSFHKKYLRFDQKYSNIHQNFIDPQYVDEFAEHLSPNTIQEIHQRTTDVLDFCPPEFFDL